MSDFSHSNGSGHSYEVEEDTVIIQIKEQHKRAIFKWEKRCKDYEAELDHKEDELVEIRKHLLDKDEVIRECQMEINRLRERCAEFEEHEQMDEE